jgi:ribulose-5-phosphate 4-epimerase/fuculose-1-phosphate aldolase
MLNYAQFASVEQERYYRNKMLVVAYRNFGKLGFSEGLAGDISCRDPEYPDCFWVNPFGMYFKRLKISDLVL